MPDKCLSCGRKFTGRRSKFCSVNCDQADYRKRKRLGIPTPRRKSEKPLKERQRAYYLKAVYGLTLDAYNSMMTRQQGKCAIKGCARKPNCVDHDHKTGKVRGLLCVKCNAMLGMADDNPKILAGGIAYLKKLSKKLDKNIGLA